MVARATSFGASPAFVFAQAPPSILANASPYPSRPLGYHVNRTGRLIQQRLVELMAARGYDYPVEFWPALNHLCLAGGTMSQNDLADYLVRDKGTVARLVARMEVDGLLRREADPADARRKRLRVTPFGKTTAAALRTDVVAMIAASTRDVDAAALETCLDVLDRVFDNLLALAPHPPEPHPA